MAASAKLALGEALQKREIENAGFFLLDPLIRETDFFLRAQLISFAKAIFRAPQKHVLKFPHYRCYSFSSLPPPSLVR